MLLRVSSISAQYGETEIFSNLDLNLNRSHCLHVIGDNGAGKSTLFRILAGLKPPSSGEYYLEDSVKVAYLAHELANMSDLSARDNLDWYGSLHDVSFDFSQDLKEFNIASLLDEKVSNLSRGQRQRLALTRVVLSKASLWLLDEPLTALDRHYQSVFFSAMSKHLKAGGAAVISTHMTHLPIPHQTLRMNHVACSL